MICVTISSDFRDRIRVVAGDDFQVRGLRPVQVHDRQYPAPGESPHTRVVSDLR